MTTNRPRPIAGIAELARSAGLEGPEGRSKAWARMTSPWAPPGTQLKIGPIFDEADAVWFIRLFAEPGDARTWKKLEHAVKARRRPYQPAPGGWVGRAEIIAATAEDPERYGTFNKQKGRHLAPGPNVIDRVLSNPENVARKGITVVQLGKGRAYYPARDVLALLAEPRKAGYPHHRRLEAAHR